MNPVVAPPAPGRADHRAEVRFRRSRRTAPLFVGAVVGTALIGIILVRLADAFGVATVLPCPFHAATGLDCPGCGASRAVVALAHGDLLTALDHNVLLIGVVPVLALGWVLARAVRRVRGGPPLRLPGLALPVAVVLVLAFGVLRNLPAVPFLDAAAG